MKVRAADAGRDRPAVTGTSGLRVLVVGAGAVGGFFGGKLIEEGRDVTFLVRPGRASALARNGLTLRTRDGESTVQPRTVTADAIDSTYDVVLLAVKAYALELAVTDLRRAVGPRTVIVPAMNGMRHMDLLRESFGRERLMGGLCFIVSTLEDDGTVHQLLPGAVLTYGHLEGPLPVALTDVHATLSARGYDSALSATIEADMWEKWVFLAAGGAATTLLRGTADEITTTSPGRLTVHGIIDECVAVAKASGFPPSPAAMSRIESTWLNPSAPSATSMYRDLVHGRDVETDHVLGDLVDRADMLGVATPLLRAAHAGLSVYQASRVR